MNNFFRSNVKETENMLNILERNTEELTTLNHSTKVFHDALSNVKKGETRFHVTDSSGSVPD